MRDRIANAPNAENPDVDPRICSEFLRISTRFEPDALQRQIVHGRNRRK
jgi:hypothetical protein